MIDQTPLLEIEKTFRPIFRLIEHYAMDEQTEEQLKEQTRKVKAVLKDNVKWRMSTI